jgi:hypothetical protein
VISHPHGYYTSTVHPNPKPTVAHCIGTEVIVHATPSTYTTIYGHHTTTYVAPYPDSTAYRPIYDGPVDGYPCYACEFGHYGIKHSSSAAYLTVTNIECDACSTAIPTYHPYHPIVKPCETCNAVTLTSTLPALGGYTAPPATYTHGGYWHHVPTYGNGGSDGQAYSTPIYGTGYYPIYGTGVSSYALPTGYVQPSGYSYSVPVVSYIETVYVSDSASAVPYETPSPSPYYTVKFKA